MEKIQDAEILESRPTLTFEPFETEPSEVMAEEKKRRDYFL